MISCPYLYFVRKNSGFDLMLENQSFSEKGITAFLGPNGSGKSTLFSLFSGQLRPQKGLVLFKGQCVFEGYEKIKHKIHLISWSLRLYKELKVREHIDLLKSASPHWDESMEKELFEDLAPLSEHKVDELSKGRMAKLMLLLSLCRRPELILIDEVTNDLDQGSRMAFYQKLDGYSFQTGAQVFVATNIISDMERYASQVVFMERGRVLLNSPLDSMKEKFGKGLEEILHFQSKGEIR